MLETSTSTKARKSVGVKKVGTGTKTRYVAPSFLEEPRTQTQIRLDPALKAAAMKAALERGVSLNTFFNRAIEDFLGRLRPAEELKWTSD